MFETEELPRELVRHVQQMDEVRMWGGVGFQEGAFSRACAALVTWRNAAWGDRKGWGGMRWGGAPWRGVGWGGVVVWYEAVPAYVTWGDGGVGLSGMGGAATPSSFAQTTQSPCRGFHRFTPARPPSRPKGGLAWAGNVA